MRAKRTGASGSPRSMRPYGFVPRYLAENMPLCWAKPQKLPEALKAKPCAPETWFPAFTLTCSCSLPS